MCREKRVFQEVMGLTLLTQTKCVSPLWFHFTGERSTLVGLTRRAGPRRKILSAAQTGCKKLHFIMYKKSVVRASGINDSVELISLCQIINA